MHHRVFHHMFFMSFASTGLVFHTLSTYGTHILRSAYLFSGHFWDLPWFVCHQANWTPYILACSWALCSIHTAKFPLWYNHSSSHKEAPTVFHCYFFSSSTMIPTSPLLAHWALHPCLTSHYRVYVNLFSDSLKNDMIVEQACFISRSLKYLKGNLCGVV